MGLIQRFRDARDGFFNRRSLTIEDVAAALKAIDSGIVVSPSTVRRIPAVEAAIGALAVTISGLPLKIVYKGSRDAEPEVVPNVRRGAIEDRWNIRETRRSSVERLITSMITHDEGAIYLARNNGKINSLYVIPPGKFRFERKNRKWVIPELVRVGDTYLLDEGGRGDGGR